MVGGKVLAEIFRRLAQGIAADQHRWQSPEDFVVEHALVIPEIGGDAVRHPDCERLRAEIGLTWVKCDSAMQVARKSHKASKKIVDLAA